MPPGVRKYPVANHVEGQGALFMRENGITEADMFINHPYGMCGMCNSNLPSLLEEGSVMHVMPPSDATSIPRWFAEPLDRMGNAVSPFVDGAG